MRFQIVVLAFLSSSALGDLSPQDTATLVQSIVSVVSSELVTPGGALDLALHTKDPKSAQLLVKDAAITAAIKALPLINQLEQNYVSRNNVIQEIREAVQNDPRILKLTQLEMKKNPLAPRFVGAGILGVTQIFTDVVNMVLKRY